MQTWLSTIFLAVLLSFSSGTKLPFQRGGPKPKPTPTPTATPTPTPSPSPTPTPTPVPSTSFTVFTANLAHGQGTDNLFDFTGQAQALSSGDAIFAQEVTPGDTPNWNAAFSSLGFVNLGYASNGGTNDGQSIWIQSNKITSNGVFSKQLSSGFISWDGSTNVDKSAFAARVNVNGQSVVFVDIHLCWSRCADSQSVIDTTGASKQRVAQIHTLLDWIDQIFPGEPVILAGDFNLTRNFVNPTDGGLQIDLFYNRGFIDVWSSARSEGLATTPWDDRDGDGLPDMDPAAPRTADTREIDYIMYRPAGSSLRHQSASIPDPRSLCSQALVFDGGNLLACPDVLRRWDIREDYGPRRSDHNFVKAVFGF